MRPRDTEWRQAMRHEGELSGKVALITGAARRNGRATALALAGAGAAVVVNTRASIDEAAKLISKDRNPPSDHAATSEFRLHLAEVLGRRALNEASAG